MTSDAEPFDCRLEARDGEAWVIPTGDLDVAAAPELDESLSLALRSDAEKVVIDLRELQFLDSTGLRSIVEATRADDGPPVALVRGNDHVQRIFAVAGLVDQMPWREA